MTEKQGPRVLLVDDEESAQQTLGAVLPGAGYAVYQVREGKEAVRRVPLVRPDLILLDIGLPKLNGVEAARRILKVAPRSKIVFLTQETATDIVHEAFRLGACGYVLKTDAERELLSAMDAVMQGENFVSGGLSSTI